ncbi:MAG: 3'-5' exonuclease [Sphaerochaetaceae bacterium]
MKLVNPFHSKMPAPKASSATNSFKAKAQAQAIESTYRQQFLSHMREDCVILDTETTGIPGKCENPRIIEISIIDMEGNALLSCLLNPECTIPEDAKAVNGISDEMVSGAQTFREASRDILRVLRGKTIVGWNISFDINMLKHELDLAGASAPDFSSWDAMGPYAKATGKGRFCKLCKAAEDLEIEEEQDHRSLGDCLMTLEVMCRFVSKEQ